MANGQVRLNTLEPGGGATLSFMGGVGRLLQGALSAGPTTKDATEVGQLGDVFGLEAGEGGGLEAVTEMETMRRGGLMWLVGGRA